MKQKNDFGQFFVMSLKENDLTQKEFAGQMDLSEITVSKYATGKQKPHFSKIPQMAEILNIPLEQFEAFYKKAGEADNGSYASESPRDRMLYDFIKNVSVEAKEKIIRIIFEDLSRTGNIPSSFVDFLMGSEEDVITKAPLSDEEKKTEA